MGYLEQEIERYLQSEIKKIGGKSYKWISTDSPGVPDRIVIVDGHIFLIEVKSRKGKISFIQRKRFNEIKKLGVNVNVVFSKDDIDKFIEKITLINL